MENEKDTIKEVPECNNNTEENTENNTEIDTEKENQIADTTNKSEPEITKESNEEKTNENSILDGMREIVEYSEIKAGSSNVAYVNDRDESVELEENKNKTKKIYNTRIYRMGKKAQTWIGKKLNPLMEHPIITVLLLALFCELFIETMSRSSLFGAFGFMFKSPIKFVLNYLIVLAPFLIALCVKKKLIPYVLFLAMWMTVGITDYYMLSFRTTPFTGVDIDFDLNELAVAVKYLSIVKSIFIIFILLLIILFIFSLLFICPNSKTIFGNRLKAMATVIVCWMLIYGSIMAAINHNLLSLKFGNLAITYHEEGIAYSLLVTIVDTGMNEPENYSKNIVENIIDSEKTDKKDNKDSDSDNKDNKDNKDNEDNKDNKDNNNNGESTDNTQANADDLPNIIFIQLESFIDPYEIEGVECSEDPIPFYRSLRQKYSSGYLKVPTIVAGTCNTEFEVISGMRIDSFGPGEYPYKTILKETTCESIAYDLKNIGYTAHAIHNNKATFYGRNLVYSHFGFDTFTSIETMCDVEETPNGWAKDMVLVDSITDCLDSTEGKDVIYTVSVQCHGTYDTVLSDEDAKIKVSGIDDKDLTNSYEYYVNMEKEVDNFVRQLIEELSTYDEDIVLVMYGDHIPGLSLSDDIMKNGDIYTTEYVIWDNMGLEKKDGDIPSYQLAANVFDRVGIHEGTLFTFHQNRADDEDSESYDSDFYTLQYDMLYGEHYAYNGVNPYEATEIEYGVNEVVIDKITPATNDDGDDCIYIEGKNFNKFSKVFVDDDKEDSELLSSSLIRVDISADDIEEGTQIVIKQINSAGTVLRESESVTYIE